MGPKGAAEILYRAELSDPKKIAARIKEIGEALVAEGISALDQQARSLRRPELDRATLLGVGLGGTVRRAQGGGERHAGVGVMEERVGRACDRNGGARLELVGLPLTVHEFGGFVGFHGHPPGSCGVGQHAIAARPLASNGSTIHRLPMVYGPCFVRRDGGPRLPL